MNWLQHVQPVETVNPEFLLGAFEVLDIMVLDRIICISSSLPQHVPRLFTRTFTHFWQIFRKSLSNTLIHRFAQETDRCIAKYGVKKATIALSRMFMVKTNNQTHRLTNGIETPSMNMLETGRRLLFLRKRTVWKTASTGTCWSCRGLSSIQWFWIADGGRKGIL